MSEVSSLKVAKGQTAPPTSREEWLLSGYFISYTGVEEDYFRPMQEWAFRLGCP